ncbi:DAK2 domain-containing protein [Sanguibacter gelidistatuariae]|uniref:DAK2 domain-containing protein n=1 Tax=Sanguibacter gelidistatuariae TaxID=1814289 RepID=UPI0011138D72|nr:DAK2 domain-containing protein [Sanguibacter gelidistatuariae]
MSSEGGGDLLTVAVVRTWVVLAMELLTAARPVINEANVFPVADSDTGTNLCLTLGDGRDALDALGATAGLDEALRALARGALMGARGNSGIILSEYLRGFALGIAGRAGAGGASAAAVVAGLVEASRCAYDAVGRPREGTILTAATGAARAAAHALEAHSARVAPGAPSPVVGLHHVVDVARAGAQVALERSVKELDVLAAAGVLDAGAYGLVLILDALGLSLDAASASVVSEAAGRITIMDSLAVADAVTHPADAQVAHAHAGVAQADHTASDGEFEVMFVVGHVGADRQEIDTIASTLRERLIQVGDSVVVVGGADESAAAESAETNGTWQVHVHTDHPLAALRVADGWSQRQIVVRSLPNQVAARAHGAQPPHGVVACIASPGLVTDLARSGAVVVLRGTAPIGRDDLRRGALETTAARVTLVPADASTVRQALELAGSVLPGHGLLPGMDVVESVSDLHVVAAMSAWATSQGPGAGEPDTGGAAVPVPVPVPVPAPSLRLAGMRTAVLAVRAVTVDGSDPAALRAGLAEILADVRDGPAAVLTMLVGDLVPVQVTDDLAVAAARRCPGIEIVVLSSGRRSASLVMGVDEQ